MFIKCSSILNRDQTKDLQTQSLLQAQTFTHQLAQPVSERGMTLTHAITDSVSGPEGAQTPTFAF